MTNDCGVVSLCTAAITALVSVAFVGIAFSTDNWLHVSVDRVRIYENAVSHNDSAMEQRLDEDFRYFDRVRGIFRVCFPHADKPGSKGHSDLYLNPVDEWCTNIEYHMKLLEQGLVPDTLTDEGTVWLHLVRSCIAAFCFYFMLTAIGCVTGLMGCWKASGDHLISTATMMLFAFLCGAAGMGLWHTSMFYEMNKVFDERLEFFQTWPAILQTNSKFTLGWSYIISWFGVSLALISSLLFSMAAICIRTEVKQLSHSTYATMAHQQQHHGTLQRHSSMIQLAMPPMPLHLPSGTSLAASSINNYLSMGYPTMSQYEDVEEAKIGHYKSLVKELVDAKL